MNALEDALRDAMTEQTAGMVLPPGCARAAVRSAARHRRRRLALEGCAAVTVIGASAAAIAVTGGTGAAGPARVVVPGAGTPSAQATPTASVTRPLVIRQGAPNGSMPPAALRAITLPNPAPGFPLRRDADTIAYTGMTTGTYWTTTFLVGRTRADCTTVTAPPSQTGAVICSPTGPEATVLVTEGHEPTTPDADNRIEGHPVTDTRIVDGHSAYITHDGNQTDIYFGVGRFAVLVAGEGGASVDQLVKLAGSVQGLD